MAKASKNSGRGATTVRRYGATPKTTAPKRRRNGASASVVPEDKPPRKRRAPTQPEAVLGRPVEVDPSRQAVLESFIPALCDVFGVEPESLVGRVAADDARSLATGALRKLALGAVAMLGRDLGLPWSGLHGPGAPEVLVMAHRTTLSVFAAQFGSWTGLAIEGRDEAGPPAGELARFARDHYLRVKRDALIEANLRAAGASEAV